MRTSWAVLLCGLGLFGCATTSASAPPPEPAPAVAAPPEPVKKTPEQVKEELLAMLARETSPRGQQTLALGDKRVSVESDAPVQAVPGEGGGYRSISLSLGTAQPVTCMLYDDAIDVGTLVTKMVGAMKADFGVRGVRVTDITVVEKAPAMFLEVVYSTKGKEGALLGQVKLMLYSHDFAPVMCMHDELGYMKSFQRLATSFATGAAQALTDPSLAYQYRSINIMRIKDLPIGFERGAWVKRADGTTTTASVSCTVVPRSATDVLTTDGVTVSTIDKDGLVKEKTDIHVMSGELDRKVTLSRTKTGYHFEGQQQGKQLSGELKTSDGKGLLSELLVARLTRQLKKPLSYDDYLPTLNAAALTRLTLTKDPAVPNGVQLEAGVMKVATIVDAEGMPEIVTMQMGPVAMEQRRVFVEGKPE